MSCEFPLAINETNIENKYLLFQISVWTSKYLEYSTVVILIKGIVLLQNKSHKKFEIFDGEIPIPNCK